ncbi:GDNF family receptor alpha-like isoform X2 [Anolis carolinensis]|uniref:GDNF family receptor alpha-like isoform X2 n=1 Tax=Anolis carolinensis TaxID=28377 RepID=UPI002F2B813F
MPSTLLITTVLVLHSMVASSLVTQNSRCQELREKCMTAENGCGSTWNLVEEVCFISGNNCTVKDSIRCNIVVRFLVDEFPEFKECMCTEDKCSSKTFQAKQCSNQEGKPEPSSFSPEFSQQTKPKITGPIGLLNINDCFLAKEMCQGDDYCSMRYKDFLKACRAEPAHCSLPMAGEQCFRVWKELQRTILGNCTCPEPMQKRCTKIWKVIFNNTCLDNTQVFQTSPRSKQNYADQMKIKSQWKSSALSNYEYKHRQSCFELNVECISDEVCNRQLAKYLQVCQANETQCNVKQCQAALQFFYENIPFNVAQMLTFCDCMPSDENCHQAKKVLHGKPCAVHVVPAPSCLHVIQTCQADSFCWDKYRNFTSKCLKYISQTCLEDETCLQFLDINDLICSDSDECREAYINLWGSVLRVECTCDFTSVEDQTACKWFHHIFHSKSCFNQLSGGKAELHSSHGKLLPATGEQFLLYDETTIMIILYISCLIPILGIILLALLKSRVCTRTYQAKTVLPAHLSEKLMIPQATMEHQLCR